MSNKYRTQNGIKSKIEISGHSNLGHCDLSVSLFDQFDHSPLTSEGISACRTAAHYMFFFFT